jgi:TRAP-type C4-dicarboxylate transport system substrate-binding protein
MNNRRPRLNAKIVAALLAAGAFGNAMAQTAAKPLEITMAVIPAPKDLYSTLTSTIPDRISKATDGRVKITLNDSLIQGPQIAAAVRDGRVPMSAALHTYLAAEEPRFGIFNLPGAINGIDDYRKVGRAFWFDDTHEIWKSRYKSVVLAEGAWCSQRLFSKTPIHTLEDFKNKRLRVHNPQTAELMNAIGAKPVPLALQEVMPSLERGVIDGLFTSACYGNGQEYWRVAKNVQDWGIGPITGWAVIMNQDFWSKIPADLQKKISAEMALLEKEALDKHGNADEAALAEMKAGGALTWVAPKSERARVLQPEYVKPSYDAWIGRAKSVGFDGNAYLEKIKKVTGQ